jgi:hypothetical protein
MVAAITAPRGTFGTESVLGNADAVRALLEDDGALEGESESENAEDPRMTSDPMPDPSLFDDDELQPTVATKSDATTPATSVRRNGMGTLSI